MRKCANHVCHSNEPKGARKPVRRAITSPGQTTNSLKDSTALATPRKRLPAGLVDSTSDKNSGTAPSQPSRTPAHPSRALNSTKTSRTLQKALVAAEQAQREQYAAELFAELNRVVFKNGLPQETKLIWSKRLLTTAGRAKWHR